MEERRQLNRKMLPIFCGARFSLLQRIGHLLEIFLKAHRLIILSLHFGRQETVYTQNLPLLQGKGHAL